MADFDAKARAVVAAFLRTDPATTSGPAVDEIAAALKAAYNEGIEEAASEMVADGYSEAENLWPWRLRAKKLLIEKE